MEFSKYIVPVFADDGYRGNGFIVKCYLILPYHLIKVNPNSWDIYPSFYFLYEGNRYNMESATNNVCQGKQIDILQHPNVAQDLLVFMTDIAESNLSLSSVYDVKEECEYYGYNMENDVLMKERIIMGFIHQQFAVSVFNGQTVEQENCMTCICKLKPGNSGGIVCQGNNIIGMFIRDQSFLSGVSQSIFIKASFIIQTIEEIVGFI